MTLRHMKIFVSVFQNQSVTKASQELHLAQPSVSFALRELEEYYGIRLFERIGRRIGPTECGKEFYGYALHVVSLFDEMEKKIRNWDKLGTLRIGTSITIGTHILPTLIRQMQEGFPKLTIKARIDNSGAIERQILENTIDIGLIEACPAQPELIFEPFMADELCAIVSREHPLAGKKKVTLAQLSDYPFLMREEGSAGREILEAQLALEQLSIRPLWESASTQAIVKGVSESLGVAVLPYLLVKKDIEDRIIRKIPLARPMKRDLHIIYHKSKYLTGNMKAFITLCKRFGLH